MAKAKKIEEAPVEEVKTEAVGETAPVVEAEAPKKEKKVKKQKKEVVEKKPKHGAKYKKALAQVDASKDYTLDEAVPLLKKISYVKFPESVELHLNVLESGLKGEAQMPHSIGKTVRVAIVDDKLIDNLEKGMMDFDVLISHPQYMAKLAKFARTLGPKGLMPNPKAGTVSPNPEEAAKKFQSGATRWKTEAKFPLIHQLIGKVTLDDAQLVENARAFIKSVGPANITQAYITSTMGPSFKLKLDI